MIPPLAAGARLRNLPWNRTFSQTYTAVCKIIPACLNFRGTVAANQCLSATICLSAIFGKIGRNYRNLAGTILHNSVLHNSPTGLYPEIQKKAILTPELTP